MSAERLHRPYGMRDVQRLLKLPRAAVRTLINAGIIAPLRGPRSQLQFSFRDLKVMRAAHELLKSKIPPRRMNQSLQALRRSKLQQPSLATVGNRVVVREGDGEWQAEDGQFLLNLEMPPAPEVRARAVLHDFPARADEQFAQADWFETAVAAEEANPAAATQAYEAALLRDPTLAGAWINWGRLLHAQGEFEQAECVLRRGLVLCADHAWLHFNLAIALEDQLRTTEAIDAYLAAIQCDGELADAHFNLARLYHARADRKLALQHLARYRKLTRTR